MDFVKLESHIGISVCGIIQPIIAAAVLGASVLMPTTNGKIKHSFGDYHIIAIEQFPGMEQHTEPPTYRVTPQEGVRAAVTTGYGVILQESVPAAATTAY